MTSNANQHCSLRTFFFSAFLFPLEVQLSADCFILASVQMCFREGINPNPFGDFGAYCGGSRLAGGLGEVLPQQVG